MKEGLNASISSLGKALTDIVMPSLESGDPEREESAEKVVAAYRAVCEDFAAENLVTQAPSSLLRQADNLANEITMAAASQPTLGIEALLTPLEEMMDLPSAALKRIIREMAINLSGIANAAAALESDFSEICSGVMQEKALYEASQEEDL